MLKKKPLQFMITIPEPCSEDWGKMQAEDSVHRNCAACSTTVTDFSGMSDDELILYLKYQKEIKCGRFSTRQLSKAYTHLPDKNVNARWWRTLFLIPLTFFGKHGSAQQQDSLPIQNDSLIIDGNTEAMGSDSTVQTDSLGTALIPAVDSAVIGSGQDSLEERSADVKKRKRKTELICATSVGAMVYGNMHLLPDPSQDFALNRFNPFRKKEIPGVVVQEGEPGNVTSEDPNKKQEPSPEPLLPPAPWYEAILPSVLRMKKNV